MVVRVVALHDQVLGDRPADVVLDTLEGSREVEADDRRGVPVRQLDELLRGGSRRVVVFGQELDRPGADVLILVVQSSHQLVVREAAGDVERPHRPQAQVAVRVGREHLVQRIVDRSVDFALRRPALQDDPGPARVPGALRELQLDEFLVRHRLDVVVAALPVVRQGLLGRDAEDAPGLLVLDVVAADVRVVPVEDVDVATRPDLHAEADPLLVVGQQEVLAVVGDEAGTLRLQFVREHGVLVDVRHEEPAVVFFGEGVREVDAGAAVRGAVTVVDDRADVAVDVRIEVRAALTVVDASGDHVEQVGDHAGGDEDLTLRVVVDAPGVAEAVGDDLEAVLGRVVAPDAAVDVDSVVLEQVIGEGVVVAVDRLVGSRLADPGGRREPFEAVEPAVGAPVEAVDRLVTVADAPAGQQDLGVVHVGDVVAVAVGEVEEVGRRADEDAVEADRKRRREGDALREDLLAVGGAVAVRVLQDQDAAVAGAGETASAGLVVAVLGDPHAAAVVPGEGHGLGDHGLRGPGVDLESLAHGHRINRLFRGQELLLLRFPLGDAP